MSSVFSLDVHHIGPTQDVVPVNDGYQLAIVKWQISPHFTIGAATPVSWGGEVYMRLCHNSASCF
jgi:hypothetical protein